LSKGRPVLLGLILPHENDRTRSHYEVAIALNSTDGTLITIDPATGGWMRRTPQVLDIEWKPAGYVALVVTGDKSPTAVGDAGWRGDVIASRPMAKPPEYNATLVERIDVTDALSLFRVKPDQMPAERPWFVPGQYCVLGLNNQDKPDLGSVRRSMSIASAP